MHIFAIYTQPSYCLTVWFYITVSNEYNYNSQAAIKRKNIRLKDNRIRRWI